MMRRNDALYPRQILERSAGGEARRSKKPRYFSGLSFSTFHQEISPGCDQTKTRGGDHPIGLQTVRSTVECQSRLMACDFRHKPLDYRGFYIRWVGNHEIERAAEKIDWIYEPTFRPRWYPGFPERLMAATLTCSPWTWVLVAPSPLAPEGFVNVATGETHPIVW